MQCPSFCQVMVQCHEDNKLFTFHASVSHVCCRRTIQILQSNKIIKKWCTRNIKYVMQKHYKQMNHNQVHPAMIQMLILHMHLAVILWILWKAIQHFHPFQIMINLIQLHNHHLLLKHIKSIIYFINSYTLIVNQIKCIFP